MRTQWTTKGNRDAGSSCLCDRGLHRYLRNFGGRVWTSQTPPRYATGLRNVCWNFPGMENRYNSTYPVHRVTDSDISGVVTIRKSDLY